MPDWLFSFFYQIIMTGYAAGVKIAAGTGNQKAKKWQVGRKGIFEKINTAFSHNHQRVIWFHCASLGEFEQGRPLMERWKNQYPNDRIVLTFFSPSGYEIRKNTALADDVFYLPLDTPANAHRFVSIARPALAIFVKYDIWYFYFKKMQQRSIPVVLIAADFRKKHWFFNPLAAPFFKVIKNCDYIFTQNERTQDLLKKRNCQSVMVAGDPRVDRVFQFAQKAEPIPILKDFKKTRKMFVWGSTHPSDEELLRQWLETFFLKNNEATQNWCLLIVPHEVAPLQIAKTRQRIGVPSVLFSEWEATPNPGSVLILNTVGHLNAAYQYADLAYIGGGFDGSIHNVLEPATFGVPVIFGKDYQRFPEAVWMLDNHCAFSVHDASELQIAFKALVADTQRRFIQEKLIAFITKNTGATERIFQQLLLLLKLKTL